MIRRPPRSTLDRSSAASDVYKRQVNEDCSTSPAAAYATIISAGAGETDLRITNVWDPVSYTHLRAHETVLDLVCRLLLEKKNNTIHYTIPISSSSSKL